MARYLRTSSISAELETLIRDAKKKLYIISPYLKLSDNIRELLNDKEREKVEVRIIFGKQELAPAEMSYLEGLSYVRLYFSKNLHAKCYLNEEKMIIASMNLYEFSQQNNKEMGILIDTQKEEDREVYQEAERDIDSIIHNSEDFSYVKAPQKGSINDVIRSGSSSEISAKKGSSNTNYKTTKELSLITGINSRKINAWFIDNKLMYKKDEDWILTQTGVKLGGLSREGQYGKFIIWPEDVAKSIK